jgi:aldose 1-epimerase
VLASPPPARTTRTDGDVRERDRPRPVGVHVPSTGSQFMLEHGNQRAVVTEVGATLRSWRVGEREQLDTFDIDEAGDGFRGKVLAPWPNRIRDSRYTFGGAAHQVPISEPERGNALHGLVLWANWHPLRHSSDALALGYMLHPQPGYPFTLELEVAYRLSDGGLEVTLRAANRGAAAAPFGAGFHPYLALAGTRVADAKLAVRAGTRVPVDERLLPSGPRVPVAGTEYDFRRLRPLGPLALDTCFGDLERDADGLARATLAAGPDGRALSVWMDERFRFIHVYTSRTGVAIEPMTCAPDAFNSGDGLLALAPGASFAGRWGLNTQREVQ